MIGKCCCHKIIQQFRPTPGHMKPSFDSDNLIRLTSTPTSTAL